ncbi:MAG: thrombospondin type 3 repeat-containing protein, partial [Myxococcota bacterium]
VAGFGSGKVGVYDVSEIDADTFVPNASDAIPVEGGGPSGLWVSGSNLYVPSRFDNSLRVFDLLTHDETQRLVLHNPEPESVVAGRPFLYDARRTASNGESSCASCHIEGDFDSLAWNLGDPDGFVVDNLNPFNQALPDAIDPMPRVFHPHKGPMTTQSLRGLANMGPQHWRGDRQGDEAAAFEAFAVAFPGLLGRDEGPLDPADMTAFRVFALQLRYPPSGTRALDNQPRNPPSGPNEAAGAAIYGTQSVPGPPTDITQIPQLATDCQSCHILRASTGDFGGDGESINDGGTQHFKIPHLRNAYQKIGMFFAAGAQQVRGYGFLHDGSVPTLKIFLGGGNPNSAFDLDGFEEDDLEAFIMAFPTDLAPMVGQQVTLNATLLAGTAAAEVNARVDLMIERAGTPFISQVLGGLTTECELVAQVMEGGNSLNRYLLNAGGSFTPDDGGLPISEMEMRSKAEIAGQEVTFTCAPPGSGNRMALDRDEDALLNGLDNCPGAPNAPGGGTCTAGDSALLGTACSLTAACGAGGFCSTAQEDSDANGVGDACEPTLLPEPAANGLLASGLLLLWALSRARGSRSS